MGSGAEMGAWVLTWPGMLAMGLLAVSVLTLGVTGIEQSHQLQTFSRSSPEEQAHERRAMWLRTVGFVSIGAAAVIGLLGALKLLQ